MPIFFTTEEIRTAINEYKLICRSKNYGYFLFELKRSGNGVYKIFEGDYDTKLTKSERSSVLDFYHIIHILYTRSLGEIKHRPTYYGLLELITDFKRKDIYNDYLTENEVLEDYFKPLIHANEFIKPKNTDECIVIVCAIIKIYDDITLFYGKC
jgi:hypothetical protein